MNQVRQDYDQDYVIRLKQQDSAAFRKLFDDLATAVFRRAFIILGSQSSAEDAVQEVFYRAWLSLPKLSAGNLRAWLLTITRNYCFDELRRKKRKPETLREEPGLLLKLEPVNSNGTDGLNDTDEILQRLPEEIRVPLLLKVVEDLSYKEIAQITEKAEGTLRNLVCRGMKILRNELDQDEL